MSLLFVIGTRPEAIKMAPVILECQRLLGPKVLLCVTAQHRDMLDQVLEIFGLVPDDDLNLMSPNQTLAGFASLALTHLYRVFEERKPARVIVHGDTATTFIAALAAFYHQIPTAHIEAGLRTHQRYSPWPEEMNRRLTAQVCDLHFAPTALAARHLMAEGIAAEDIQVTGNTVIDAVLQSRDYLLNHPNIWKRYQQQFPYVTADVPMILVTFHRREHFGEKAQQVVEALKQLAQRCNATFVIPVHPNPNVFNLFHSELSGFPQIHLIKPQDYLGFLYLMINAKLILTDSGGIQEEAPSLNKPIVVLRDVTERPEVIEIGAAVLAGTSVESIVTHTLDILENPARYEAMAQAPNPYGDGKAAQRIAQQLCAPWITQPESLKEITL